MPDSMQAQTESFLGHESHCDARMECKPSFDHCLNDCRPHEMTPTMAISMRTLITLVLMLVTFVTLAEGFSILSPSVKDYCSSAPYSLSCLSRLEFLSVVFVGSSMACCDVRPANADDVEGGDASITPCKVEVGGPTNCVSTASVRQVGCYAPPWTFQVSPEEAMARLKGVLISDSSYNVEQVTTDYIRVSTVRGLVTDELEFRINEQDKVVTFRSAEKGDAPSVSDFGLNRKRLEELRKKAGVFGVMGEGLTADSFEGGGGGGPLGQLKAFYGLQSGKGFEDVFED